MRLILFGGKRSENGAIARTFSSAVYNKRTQARKRLARVTLYGRSMVEMLGVLAIIGVLSVGGLEGYSRAMYKYKLNTMTDQVNTILSTISRYRNELKISDFSTGEYSLVPFLKKLNELPENMFRTTNDQLVYDVFGNYYHIYHHNTGYIGVISRINNGHEQATDICRNLYMIAKNYSNELSHVMIWDKRSDNPHDSSQIVTAYGDLRCFRNPSIRCLKNLQINEADQLCKTYQDSDNLLFYFIFE